MAKELKIESITIKHIRDEHSDGSDTLGKYSNTPKEGAIDRQERGDMRRGEFQYFIPAMTAEETGNPNSPEQDYQRAEALNKGEWGYIGIRAEATIIVNGIIQKISSGGLWGIESDSDKDYFREVAEEQMSELADTLQALGFKKEVIKKALKSAKVKEE